MWYCWTRLTVREISTAACLLVPSSVFSKGSCNWEVLAQRKIFYKKVAFSLLPGISCMALQLYWFMARGGTV